MLLKFSLLLYVFFILDLFGFIENKILLTLTRHKNIYQQALDNGNYQDLYVQDIYGKNETNHSIALYRYLDNEFYGVVHIGSRNKSFNVQYDTAWTNSWVISSNCPSTKIGCLNHAKYDHSTSATAKPTNETFFVNQGAYNISGTYTYDNINVGGLRVLDHKFAEVTDVPPSYSLVKSDGVIGLGLPYNNEKTFFRQLMEQGAIKRGIFSLYMNRDRSSIHGGVICLGFYSTKHVHVTNGKFDPIIYVPVDATYGLWQFSIDGIYVEEKKVLTPGCTKNCVAFIDSTSNDIVAPIEGFKSLNSIIESRPWLFGKYEVDCDIVNKLPKLHFIIAGHNFTLTGKQYVQKISYMSVQLCISALRPIESPSETNWILGGSFLSLFYSIYDIDNLKIGFVRAA